MYIILFSLTSSCLLLKPLGFIHPSFSLAAWNTSSRVRRNPLVNVIVGFYLLDGVISTGSTSVFHEIPNGDGQGQFSLTP